MLPTPLRWIAAVSALPLLAAHRPHYGGELRIEMRGELDLTGPVYETLVRIDEHGDPQPWLAASWTHDIAHKRWIFNPRPNVAIPPVTIPDDKPLEEILRDLARHGNAVKPATGPFRLTSAHLEANESYWRGRPFLDRIQVRTGVPLRQQALDLDLNKTDVIEVELTDIRRLRQRGVNVVVSKPRETLALIFENEPTQSVRDALASAIDRAAIHRVLLDRQGEISGALLPQWLTGYAFLFAPTGERTKTNVTLAFAYDRDDTLIRSIAERIAVNAAEAGLTLKTGTQRADVRLVRLPVTSADAWLALEDFHLPMPEAASPYEAERALLSGSRVIPLFHLPVAYALAPNVKGWAPDNPHLDDVWLDVSP